MTKYWVNLTLQFIGMEEILHTKQNFIFKILIKMTADQYPGSYLLCCSEPEENTT